MYTYVWASSVLDTSAAHRADERVLFLDTAIGPRASLFKPNTAILTIKIPNRENNGVCIGSTTMKTTVIVINS